ncbi:hypothetical protein N9B18_00010 [Akkermansiaceae bacterium]|nr:hypothetical protein [Akkermansiaceae bacterium]MDA7909394.1 hypothetical protein [Akkermansiaceae bacterium]MDB4358119.1 hypothetical protein [bacterium]MDB4490557.1 hypothetical protein [bacterium]
MIEEASVNELLCFDIFITVVAWKVFLVFFGDAKLVLLEVAKFFEVIVSGIWSGKITSNGEVEFGGEFEVDELVGFEITEKEVEFANGGVNVFLDLEVSFQEIVAFRRRKDLSEGVFVKVAELL